MDYIKPFLINGELHIRDEIVINCDSTWDEDDHYWLVIKKNENIKVDSVNLDRIIFIFNNVFYTYYDNMEFFLNTMNFLTVEEVRDSKISNLI